MTFNLKVEKSADLEKQEMARAREEALSTLYHETDQIRSHYVPPMRWQDGVYLLKAAEARAYLAQDSAPTDLSPYPHIAAEAADTGDTVGNVAAAVVAKADGYSQVSAPLEAARIRAQSDIEAATDDAGVQAALDAFRTAVAAL